MVKIDKQMTFYAFFPSTFGNRGPSPNTTAHKKKLGFGQVDLVLKPGCLNLKPGALKLRYIAPSHSPLFMSSCVSLANIASAQIAACVTHAFCYSSSKQSAVHK